MEKETRSLGVELRARNEAQDDRVIVGYAAKFNCESGVIGGWFKEIIARGAFDGADISDVVATYNHNFDYMLGRTLSGTLKLEVDEVGLRFEVELPNTSWGDDVLIMVRRGDLNKCSFIFTCDRAEWCYDNEEYAVRTILKFNKIFDVSLVVHPAYDDTEVSARYKEERSAFDAHKIHEARENEDKEDDEPIIDYNTDREWELIRLKMRGSN